MPAIKKSSDIQPIVLPSRAGKVAATTDVLVVGGGPAGIGAALGARRAGAEVVLAERYGFLGGNATAALVIPLMTYHTQEPHDQARGATPFFPTDHGVGQPVVAGVVTEFIDRLVRAGGAIPPSVQTGYVITFDPEIFKWVALEMLDSAGVELLFHAFASDVLGSANAQGGIFETKSGPVVIKAKTLIDCTGDGDLAARAGAPYEVGRIEDGRVQPMSLMFRMVDFDKSAFSEYAKANPDQWRGVHGLWNLVQKAQKAGDLQLPREDILFFATPHNHEISVNSTRLLGFMGTDVWDLTKAEMAGRWQVRQISAFLKKYVPGFTKSYVVQSGVQVGVRETRRIMGDYKLTTHDVLAARKFDDVIARCSYPIDIHNPTGRGTILRRLPPGQSYDIPLRCLIPRRVEHLILAGRCISGTHQAHSSYRCMPTAMATGHAAGVCAALAVRHGKSVRQVEAKDVQHELLRQGAILH